MKYDDDFVLWLIVVCEWVGGGLFVMGSCVVCAWCCCYVVCGCMNGASPVRFVLSLLYIYAFQMNPVCVVCGWLHLIEVCFFLTEVTNPNDWSVFVCRCCWARI